MGADIITTKGTVLGRNLVVQDSLESLILFPNWRTDDTGPRVAARQVTLKMTKVKDIERC